MPSFHLRDSSVLLPPLPIFIHKLFNCTVKHPVFPLWERIKRYPLISDNRKPKSYPKEPQGATYSVYKKICTRNISGVVAKIKMNTGDKSFSKRSS